MSLKLCPIALQQRFDCLHILLLGGIPEFMIHHQTPALTASLGNSKRKQCGEQLRPLPSETLVETQKKPRRRRGEKCKQATRGSASRQHQRLGWLPFVWTTAPMQRELNKVSKWSCCDSAKQFIWYNYNPTSAGQSLEFRPILKSAARVNPTPTNLLPQSTSVVLLSSESPS